MTPRRLVALLLLCAGLVAIAEAGWIRAKAMLAQHLLDRSWSDALAGGEAPPPWPWADTRPIARLVAEEYGIDQIVLSGASLRNLAFAPAHFDGTPLPGQPGNAVIAGHRDTHFAFLRDLEPGDELVVERPDRSRHRYVVAEVEIVAADDRSVLNTTSPREITLVTCYPFDAVGRPQLRYTVRAIHARHMERDS